MSDSNKLPVKRDWMDWVQTGAAVYGAYKVGQLADQAEEARGLAEAHRQIDASLPRSVDVPETFDIPEWRKKAVREASLETHPFSDKQRVFGQRMLFFRVDAEFRQNDTAALYRQSGRPLFNLYDSLSMFRDTVESAYKRATDPWSDSNERYACEIANHAQLDWMRRSLPEDQQDDFWEWQTFMLSRHYARELLNKAAWNNERPQQQQPQPVNNRIIPASVTPGKVILSLLICLGFIALVVSNGGPAGAPLLFAVCAFPAVLLVLCAMSAITTTVVTAGTDAARKARQRPPPRRNRREPNLVGLKQKIAWLVKVGWLPEGSPTFAYDAVMLREQMQKAAVRWRRRPIIQAYIKARRHYYWELSFAGRRRGLDAELQQILTSPVDEELREKGFFHRNSNIKYMPPGPERDALVRHEAAAMQKERQDVEELERELKSALKARGYQP